MARIVIAAMLVAVCAVISSPASAQGYPKQPIRIIVPAAAGSVSDVNVRRISDKLAQALGQPVTIDNRPGVNGNLGAEIAAKSKPDGYTLLLVNSALMCINPVVYTRMTFNPIDDFVPITLNGKGSPLLLVAPKFPANTLAEFIAYAKTNPGKISFGSPGIGSPQHLAGEQLMRLAGIKMTHVPYKSAPQVLTDLMGGQIQAAIEFPSISVAHVKSGQLRGLVVVGPNRKPSVPDVPTSAEAGLPAFTQTSWNGYVAPKGTPPEIVARLQKELALIIRGKETQEWAATLGSEAVGSTSAEFAAFIKDECPRWQKVAQEAGIRLD